VNYAYVPIDTIGATQYVDDDYVDNGYISDVGGVGLNYNMRIRLGHVDGDNNNNKFMSYLRPVMNKTISSDLVNLYWSDDDNASFILGGTVDPSFQYNNLQRCGRFYRRNIELQYQSSEQVYIEAIEARVKMGTV